MSIVICLESTLEEYSKHFPTLMIHSYSSKRMDHYSSMWYIKNKEILEKKSTEDMPDNEYNFWREVSENIFSWREMKTQEFQ